MIGTVLSRARKAYSIAHLLNTKAGTRQLLRYVAGTQRFEEQLGVVWRKEDEDGEGEVEEEEERERRGEGTSQAEPQGDTPTQSPAQSPTAAPIT